MNEIIYAAVYLGITVAAFVLGKYIFPNVPKTVTDKLNDLAGWAARFVVWAREFMQSSTGEEKMEMVVQKLKEIAEEAGFDVTEDQLKAIAQAAYEAMKEGEAQAQPLEALAAAPTIAIYNTTNGPAGTEVTAELTDDVPEGALEENEDGSVNVYDEAGNKTGTVPAAVAEAAATNVTVIIGEGTAKK